MYAARHAIPHARRRPVALLGGSHLNPVAEGSGYDTTYRLTAASGPSALLDVQVVLAGWYCNAPAGPETNVGNSVTYKLAIEYNGASYPVYFSGGSRTVAVASGATVVSLPCAVSIPAAATFEIRVESQATGNVPQTEVIYSNTNAASDSVDGTGVLGGGATGTQPGVVALLGRMQVPAKRTVAVVGDSIAEGYYTGRTYGGSSGQGDNVANRGYVRGGLAASFASVCVAVPGESVNPCVNGGGYAGRLELLRICQCDYAVCEYGTNDLYALSRTDVQLEADLVTMWFLLVPRCPMGVYQTTITPRTTSTDGWITTTNQTIKNAPSSNGNGYRVLFNNWVRDGSPIDPVLLTPVATGTGGALRAGSAGHPLKGYFEIADLAESARDSGLWTATAPTSEGTHPNGTHGVPQLAPGINTALFV